MTTARAEPPAVGPAPTRWAPTVNAPASPPMAPSRLPVTPIKPPAPEPTAPTIGIPAPPPPATPTPNRVVVFQKPAGTETATPTIPIAPAPQKKNDTKPVQPGQEKLKPPSSIDDPGFTIRPSTVLTREKVFQLTSDAELRKRIAHELYEEEVERQKRSPDPTRKVTEENYQPPVIPPIGAGVAYQTKVLRYGYPAMQTLVEPHYIVHRRLLFEEKNADRFGWDAGIVQPLISTAYFYKDVLLWPAHLASQPFERFDTSAGKCQPGDPVPYYLYPPEIDLFGGTLGAGAIIGTVFLFP